MKRKLSPRNMFSNLYGCGAQTTRSTRRGPRPGRPRPESAWKKVHALGNLPCSVEETTPKPHRPHTSFSLILSSPLYLSAQHVMFPCRAAAQQQLAAAETWPVVATPHDQLIRRSLAGWSSPSQPMQFNPRCVMFLSGFYIMGQDGL